MRCGIGENLSSGFKARLTKTVLSNHTTNHTINAVPLSETIRDFLF